MLTYVLYTPIPKQRPQVERESRTVRVKCHDDDDDDDANISLPWPMRNK